MCLLCELLTKGYGQLQFDHCYVNLPAAMIQSYQLPIGMVASDALLFAELGNSVCLCQQHRPPPQGVSCRSFRSFKPVIDWKAETYCS
jgi:hypothetical protein